MEIYYAGGFSKRTQGKHQQTKETFNNAHNKQHFVCVCMCVSINLCIK